MITAILDFFGFIFIMFAAFTISSKTVNVNAKLRLFAFSSYLVACFFLILWGWSFGGTLFTLFTLQQLVLTGINVRGMYYAIKTIKLDKWNESCNEM